MAIVELAQIREYLNISTPVATKDDQLLMRLIDAAQQLIEERTRRRFAPGSATRNYGPECATGALLFLDDDLLSVTSLLDGSGANVPGADYRLEPRNYKPYSIVRILKGRAWLFNQDGEVAITGLWGYDDTCPHFDVAVQAVIRTTAWLYRQRDTSSDQDRPIASDSGMLIMPSRLPSDIYDMIQPLRRQNR